MNTYATFDAATAAAAAATAAAAAEPFEDEHGGGGIEHGGGINGRGIGIGTLIGDKLRLNRQSDASLILRSS